MTTNECTYLVDRYDQIEDEDLREKEEEIKEIKYELVNLIVNIFNKIEAAYKTTQSNS